MPDRRSRLLIGGRGRSLLWDAAAVDQERALIHRRTPGDCPTKNHHRATDYNQGCTCPGSREAYRISQKRRKFGYSVPGFAEAGETRAKIGRLRDLGWPWKTIAAAAGRSSVTLMSIRAGRITRVTTATAQAVQAIPETPLPTGSIWVVSAIGTLRRLQALMCMGWSIEIIAERSGCRRSTLDRVRNGQKVVRASTAARVAKVYDELSMTRGPSKRTAATAQRRHWVPPLGWDDDEIDDPAAQHHLERKMNVCVVCGEAFEAFPSRPGYLGRKTCGAACQRIRLKQGGAMGGELSRARARERRSKTS